MRRTRRQAEVLSESEASEEIPSTSDASTEPTMTPDERQMAISALNMILNTAATKTPVKRADIVKQCLKGNNGQFVHIFDIAKEWLSDIYGMTALELKDDKTSKGFICISKISGASPVELTNEQRRNLKLLFLVLSYIYMKGESVMEAALFAFLRKLGIEDLNHPTFGDYKKIITETFVKQLYLKREKVVLESGGTDERYQYQWGLRTSLEFTKKDIFDNVAKIMERPVFMFAKQHEEIYGDDEANNTQETGNESRDSS